MRSLSKVLIAAAIVAAVVFGVRHFLRPVAVVSAVHRGRAVDAVPASVGVLAERAIPIVSDAGGRLLPDDFALDPGQQVREGEVLARLDSRALQLQIDSTKGEIASIRRRIEIGSPTQIELDNAREFLAAAERQAKAGSLSEADLTRQRRQVAGIEQRMALERAGDDDRIRNAENTLARLQLQLESMTILSPTDGQLSEVFVNPGQLIGSGTMLATLIKSARTVEARVSEENFAGVKIGQNASVRFLTFGDRTFDATVKKILPTADPATQRYVIHLEVDLNPADLAPGITGEASILVGRRENALIIPRRALIGNRVLAVIDGRVEQREVEVGYTSLNAVEILEGLAEGDLVVVEQLDRFRDGDRVGTERAP